MKISFLCSIIAILAVVAPGCRRGPLPERPLADLQDSLHAIIAEYPGEIGVAIIYNDCDTITVNDEPKYPMMSVFKLHQAIAACDYMERSGLSLDSLVTIPRAELNPDTWSPMLRENAGDTICISFRGLMEYTLEQSDNNASNWLFDHLLSPRETDRYIATLIPQSTFRIRHSEAEMLADHRLAYDNATSPLGAAMLINRLYTAPSDAPIPGGDFIRACLERCATGTDRIVAGLPSGLRVGHKTGSGFHDGGVLAAHNDVAFITLPDGRHYSLAVFVKDFPGPDSVASRAVARISEMTYHCLTKK